MNLKILIVSMFVFFMFGCMGQDSQVDMDHENMRGYCMDGIDNDGDGHYDCYDPDCKRVNDSLIYHFKDTICHYEDYSATQKSSSSQSVSSSSLSSSVTLQSSSENGSSSSVESSSSVKDSSLFLELIEGDDDSVQITALYRQSGSNQIGYAGQIRNLGVMGILDTLGNEVQAPLGINLNGALSRTLTDLDMTPNGGFNAVGWISFADSSKAYSYVLNQSSSDYNYALSQDQLIFQGFPSSTTACYVTNDSTMGFVFVDQDISDLNLPSALNILKQGSMVRGEVINQSCAGLGNRSTNDSTQIWLMVTSSNNVTSRKVQVTTGSTQEVGFDFETISDKTYVAATVDGQIRLLVLGSGTALTSAGVDLGSGTPRRLAAIQVDGNSKILMIGDQDSKGHLWIFNPDGSLENEVTIPETQTLTDIEQLGDESLILSGWKSAQGTGTVGVIFSLPQSKFSMAD